MNQVTKLIAAAALCCGSAVLPAHFVCAQARSRDAALVDRRNAIEKQLESVAIIERKVMVPMHDGKRMQADIYRPKDGHDRPSAEGEVRRSFNGSYPPIYQCAYMLGALQFTPCIRSS